jgi:glutathione S-transferase
LEPYFSPMACSLACRIAIYEAHVEGRITMLAVNLKTKLMADGFDYRTINPMGQMPALRTDDGQILTENTAILLHIADQTPEAKTGVAFRL